MGQHIDLKSSLSQKLKSFLCKKGPKVIFVVIFKLQFEFKANPIVIVIKSSNGIWPLAFKAPGQPPLF